VVTSLQARTGPTFINTGVIFIWSTVQAQALVDLWAMQTSFDGHIWEDQGAFNYGMFETGELGTQVCSIHRCCTIPFVWISVIKMHMP